MHGMVQLERLTSSTLPVYAGPANIAYKSFALSVQPANASVGPPRRITAGATITAQRRPPRLLWPRTASWGSPRTPPSDCAFWSPTRAPEALRRPTSSKCAETATCGSGTYTDGAHASTGHWQIVDHSLFHRCRCHRQRFLRPDRPRLGHLYGRPAQGHRQHHRQHHPGVATDFTEIEFAVQATANATAGGDYCFRLSMPPPVPC